LGAPVRLGHYQITIGVQTFRFTKIFLHKVKLKLYTPQLEQPAVFQRMQPAAFIETSPPKAEGLKYNQLTFLSKKIFEGKEDFFSPNRKTS